MPDLSDVRAGFAERMNTLCDELGVVRGHGRNASLGRMFDVTPNAARKWLLGLAYPEMPLAVSMCDKARINLIWLLQGTPPMRGERIPESTLGLVNAIEELPTEQRNAVLEYARFQLQRTPDWFSPQALRRHLAAIDTVHAQPGPETRRQAQAAPEVAPQKRTGTGG